MKPNYNNLTMHKSSAKKQRGATLFTALIFLALMTIVSVSAAKITMLDVLVSGNNQQQMELFQETAREIDDHADPAKLLILFADQKDTINPTKTFDYNYTPAVDTPHTDENITSRAIEYQCGAIAGLATSQGADNSCRLYDFEVRTQKANSSARDRHLRGGGKEFPSASRNNFNN